MDRIERGDVPGGLRHAALLEMADGAVWDGTVKGVFRPNVTNWLAAAGSGIDKAHDVRCLMETPDGSVWADSREGLLRYAGEDRLVAGGGPEDAVLCLFADKDGILWAGTQSSGLWWREPDSLFTAFRSADGLPSNMVRVLHRSQGDVLWAGTPKGLAVVTQEKGMTHIRASRHRLPDADIWQIVDDRAGDLLNVYFQAEAKSAINMLISRTYH